ncbi:hypothetical protein B0T19DRAFT_154665 [Cercophora scortea]|uniref:Uncharacterized protein n=1 Tax=Cercophora scortea TaxID=314031 RepID=A0AAE0MC86_9PEZI|nr:hypothetical protein B0T19DRAFT_154665 [Cercophora scortea]
MNFPTPPASSIHDPLLNPPTSTPSTSNSASSAARPKPPLPARDQPAPALRPRRHQAPPSSSPPPPPPPPPFTGPGPDPLLQQSQQLASMMNGINGNMPGAMVGLPTPAGHQAELNYIYGMVEELSRQLAQNQRALEDVVTGVGRVRNRARTQSLGNEELINAAADDVKAQDPNMDALISLLSEALEKAKFSRDANAALLSQYAAVLSSMLKQFHDYKSRHVNDVASWHRSYRSQLAEARAENSRLREQIWEMQAHAGAANEMLRKFRTRYDEDAARWERRVDAKAARQELRFWKRMAMPELKDDDPYWSDDDDLIDEVEKKRLTEYRRQLVEQQLAAAAAAQAMSETEGGGSGGEDGDGSGAPPPPPVQNAPVAAPVPAVLQGILGGVPMQRDDTGGSMGPVPPPRPSSAASSTGSTGQ